MSYAPGISQGLGIGFRGCGGGGRWACLEQEGTSKELLGLGVGGFPSSSTLALACMAPSLPSPHLRLSSFPLLHLCTTATLPLQVQMWESPAHHNGITVSIQDGFACSMSFAEESEVRDPFATGRVMVPVPSHRLWSIRNVACEVANAEIRLASRTPQPSSGGAGAVPSEASVRGTGEFPTDKLVSLAHFRIRQPNSKVLVEHLKRSRHPSHPFLYKYVDMCECLCV